MCFCIGGGRGGFGDRGGRGGGRGGRGGFGDRGGRGAPRGGGRGGRGGAPGGGRGGAKVVVVSFLASVIILSLLSVANLFLLFFLSEQEPHRHEGVFVSRGKEDHLLTRSTAPGLEVYGEKRVSVDNQSKDADGAPVTTKVEYRVWNPFRSKLAAGIIGGIDNIYMKPGSKASIREAILGEDMPLTLATTGPVSWCCFRYIRLPCR